MQQRKISSYVKGSIGFAISASIILWLYNSLDWRLVGGHLAQVRLVWLIPATFVFFIHYFLRGLRWRYFLPQGENLSVKPLFEALMVGNFATYILPFRAGEFIRPYMYTLQSNYTFPSTFVSVVIERFFDLASVLLSFGIVTTMVSGGFSDQPWIFVGAIGLSILAAGILAFILIGILASTLVLQIVHFVVKAFPTKLQQLIVRFVTDFLEGARVLRSGRNLSAVLSLSALVWLTNYLFFYFFLFLFPSFTPSYLQAVTVGVIVALAVAAPSAPGFIGVYQVGCVVALALFGVSQEEATAYAVITHAYQYILVSLLGLLILLKNKMSLKTLARGRHEGVSS